ncbi:protein ECT2 [Lissotriton helveticus]
MDTMCDQSVMSSVTGRSLLSDTSVFIAETSKENLFNGSEIDEEMPQIETRVVLVQDAGQNEELLKALETVKIMEVPVVKLKEHCPGKPSEKFIKSIVNMEIKVSYIKTETVEEFGDADSPEFETVFVLSDFQNPVFNHLYKAECRILGPPIVLYCSQKGEPLPFTSRPLYSPSMLNLVLCFTGFRRKDELVRLVNLVHHMGGTIKRDFSSKVTHLVASSTHGDKFRVAVSLGTPIMKTEWILKAWEKRNEVGFSAANEEFRNEFKVPPFQDCILSFLGFSDEEKASMEEMAVSHGGQCLPVGNENCSHLVVEENTVKQLHFEPSKKLYVVKQEWFWGSIQMDARAGETMYSFEKAESPALKKSVSLLSLSTPNSNRKKRRLKDTIAQLSRDAEAFPPLKRPSGEHSLSFGSLLDLTNTPDAVKFSETPTNYKKTSKNCTSIQQTKTARWQVAMELYQTESNYVDILSTVVQIFQIPLEKDDQCGGPILAQEEIKTIFGSIPDILDVHTKIKDDLENLMRSWVENKSIGAIILNYSKDLVKTYPPFVNFFEMSKETIAKCERQKPRFHAFLKINQARSECGRQTLAELLIRPVQRLPSVALLLNDLKKHTTDDNPDKVTLEKAIESLKEVMTHINEDKRKTESQRQIFDVVYEVDGCPANLLSSHRLLVQRMETIALSNVLCDRGEQVTLFLFNDCLEIARKRHKVPSFKSPHGQTRPPASLKHISLMPLSQIKRVLDVRETEDCRSAFALVVRPPTEQTNQLFSFQLTSEEPPKVDWLKMLCRQVANTICKADSVTRAFSFSKTPKRALHRVVMVQSTPDGWSPPSHLTSTTSLSGVPSPSLINLPSLFEKKYHTISRSTTHLI